MVYDAGLKTLVDGLRRSVIDLYMTTQGWKARDDDYYVEVLGWQDKYLPVFHDTPQLCARPDTKGLRRGGEIYDHAADLPQGDTEGKLRPSDRLVKKFDELWGRIDDIVDRWYDLPDPVVIGEAVTAYTKTVDNLLHGTDENLTGDGSLPPNMTRIWDDLVGHVEEGGYYEPALSGESIDVFKDYIKNLDRALGGCGAIATELMKYVDAQQQLWSAVQRNVHTIVSSVANKCDFIVKNTQFDTGPGLEDVSLGAGVASAAAGPVGLTATGVDLIVTVIGATRNNPVPLTVEIESSDGALDVLDKLLNTSFNDFGVSQMIETFERQTCARIDTNIAEISSQRSLFDLVPGAIETVDDVIRHDRDKANNICRRVDSVGVELGNIANQLSSCAGELRPAQGPLIRGDSILERDYRIGASRLGPTDDIVALTDLLREIVNELSGEVAAGAENFKAAMDALDRYNSETAAALVATAAAFDLSDTRAIDSFDFASWTPDGRTAREASDSFWRLVGSSSSDERTTDPRGQSDADPSPFRVDLWNAMRGPEANSKGPSTSQPWCPADPDDN